MPPSRPPARFAPPPTQFGQQPTQLKPTDNSPAGRFAPPPTRFGQINAQPKPATKIAPSAPSAPPSTRLAASRAQAKPAPFSPATGRNGGQVVQAWRWAAAAGAIGLVGAIGYRWVSSQLNQLAESLGQAAGEGLAEGAEIALDTMNPMVPVFPNRQRAHYAHELATFRAAQQGGHDARVLSFVRQRVDFMNFIRSGSRFLWSIDTDGDLCIGTPHSAVKHCIVAGDEDVFAAGMGQLELTAEEDRWLAYQELMSKAQPLERRGITDRANNPYLHDARDMGTVHQPPPRNAGLTVLLDFDSGHYAPSNAWRRTFEVWEAAGFTVKKNRESRRL